MIAFIFALIAIFAIGVGIALGFSTLKIYKRAKRYENAIEAPLSDALIGKIIKFKGEFVRANNNELIAPLSLRNVASWKLFIVLESGRTSEDDTKLQSLSLVSEEPAILQNERGENILIYRMQNAVFGKTTVEYDSFRANQPRFSKNEATREGWLNFLGYLRGKGYNVAEEQISSAQEFAIPLGTKAFAVGKLEKKEGKYMLVRPDDDRDPPILAIEEKDLSYGEVKRVALNALISTAVGIVFGLLSFLL